MSHKWVYLLNEEDNNLDMYSLVGRKSSTLTDILKVNLPIPAGFTVTTEACRQFYIDGKTINPEIAQQIRDAVFEIEHITGKRLNDSFNPLILSVRVSPTDYVPDMMETVLNIGMNDTTVTALAEVYNNRFAWDCYKRFIYNFSIEVMKLGIYGFKAAVEDVLSAKGTRNIMSLTAADLHGITQEFKNIYAESIGMEFPTDPMEQLFIVIQSAFEHWCDAVEKGDASPTGIAVVVQTMVFGNVDESGGTGIAFSRDPDTGEIGLFGDFLQKSQGDEIDGTERTAVPIDDMKKSFYAYYKTVEKYAEALENYFKDMQAISFTIENGIVYVLDSVDGKRSDKAAVQIACDLVDEGIIDEQEASRRISDFQVNALLKPQFDKEILENTKSVAIGVGASEGVAFGKIAFSADVVNKFVESGEKAILVCQKISPEDMEIVHRINGILTSRGGTASNAALVAQSINLCCVTSCTDMVIDEKAAKMYFGTQEFKEGDFISIDGYTGKVYAGIIPIIAPQPDHELSRIISWKHHFSSDVIY